MELDLYVQVPGCRIPAGANTIPGTPSVSLKASLKGSIVNASDCQSVRPSMCPAPIYSQSVRVGWLKCPQTQSMCPGFKTTATLYQY